MKADSDEELSEKEWQRRSRRSFLIAGLSALGGIAGWKWLHRQPEIDELPSPLRSGLRFNEGVMRKFYRPGRTDLPRKQPEPGTPMRLNGDLGLQSEIELASWKLIVESPERSAAKEFTMAELDRLPHAGTKTEFRCIEGWSEFITYGGIRFSDFLTATGVGTKSGKPYSDLTPREDLYSYVGFETPDREYYVSIDVESMLHPQTFLATQLNGKPLDLDHGAPLRLIIPVKYGIKSLKRIGKMFFSDQRPPDYWAERGYDWYAGL